MGQAKVRREALRKQMLTEGKKWEFPPSEWERSLCEELLSDEILRVPRAPAEWLHENRMKPKECHSNVWRYVASDPDKKSEAVAGWWLQWPDLVLHSVIKQGTSLICITPQDLSNDGELHFIPDKKISWRREGEVHVALREGQVISEWLRAFPEFTMARIAIIRERLLAGIDPMHAINFKDYEMEALKQKYIPKNCLEKYTRRNRR